MQLFIRFPEIRRYRGDMYLKLLKHKDVIENHEKYAENKAKEIWIDMQVTINAQVSALRLVEANAKDYDDNLKEHKDRLTTLRF